jgi:hypothetical protein
MDKDNISFAKKLLQYKRVFNELDAEANELIRKIAEGEDTDLDVIVYLEKRVSLISELADQSRGLKPPPSFARAYFHFVKYLLYQSRDWELTLSGRIEEAVEASKKAYFHWEVFKAEVTKLAPCFGDSREILFELLGEELS